MVLYNGKGWKRTIPLPTMDINMKVFLKEISKGICIMGEFYLKVEVNMKVIF